MDGCVRGVATARARRDACLGMSARRRPPLWAEARWVGPTARGQPDRPLPRRRTRRPPQRRCTRPEHSRGHLRTVHDPPPWPRDPEPARRSRRRSSDPKAHRPTALAPSTPRRSSPTGRRTVRVGVGRERPRRPLANTAKPKLRDARRSTSGVGSGATDQGPARLCVALPHRRRTVGSSSPRPRVDGVATASPRPGSENPGLLPMSPRGAPTTAQHCTTEPARAGERVRGTTEAALLSRSTARACTSPTGCDYRCSSARRLAKPTRPLLRTDLADVAASSTRSADPRFVAVSEPRCRLVPVPPRRSKLPPGVANTSRSSCSPSKPSHARSPRPVPGHPLHGVATAKLHDVGRDPGLVVHRAGRTPAASRESARAPQREIVTGRDETMSPSPRPHQPTRIRGPAVISPALPARTVCCAPLTLRCRTVTPPAGHARDVAPAEPAAEAVGAAGHGAPAPPRCCQRDGHARCEKRSCATDNRRPAGRVRRRCPNAARLARSGDQGRWSLPVGSSGGALGARGRRRAAVNSCQTPTAAHQESGCLVPPHEILGDRSRRGPRAATSGRCPFADAASHAPASRSALSGTDSRTGCPLAADGSLLPGRGRERPHHDDVPDGVRWPPRTCPPQPLSREGPRLRQRPDGCPSTAADPTRPDR